MAWGSPGAMEMPHWAAAISRGASPSKGKLASTGRPAAMMLKILDGTTGVRTPVVPSKILSIMAAGRPVLASLPLDGDAPRLIAAAQCGISIAPGDPQAMAQATLRFYRDREQGETMGARG